jgi:hypothetical protein
MKPTVWRDELRDWPLDRTAKLVGFVLSTYMNGSGETFVSKKLLAEGASLGQGKRAVDGAIDRLEAAGFVYVRRSKGRVSFRYHATLPNGAAAAALNGGQRRTGRAVNVAPDAVQRRTNGRATSHALRPNAFKALKASAPNAVAASAAHQPEDDCMRCGERRPLFESRGRLWCSSCVLEETGELESELHEHLSTFRAAV